MSEALSRGSNRTPQKTWDEWVNSKPESLDITNGKIRRIIRPNWYASKIKGPSAYNFSNITLEGVTIDNAFAEAYK